MKKGLILLAVLLLLTGCSIIRRINFDDPIVYNKGDIIEIETLKIEILDAEYKEMVQSVLSYETQYETSAPNLKFIDIVMNITNNGDDLNLEEYGFLVNEGMLDHQSEIAMESENYTTLDTSKVLQKGDTRRIHLFTPVNRDMSDATITVKFETKDVYEIDIDGLSESFKSIAFNEIIENDDASIVFKSIAYPKEIYPSNTSGDYEYLIQQGSGTSYLETTLTIKNKSGNDLTLSDLVLFENVNNYEFIWYTESDDKTKFDLVDTIGSNTEKQYKLLTIVPETKTFDTIRGVILGNISDLVLDN